MQGKLRVSVKQTAVPVHISDICVSVSGVEELNQWSALKYIAHAGYKQELKRDFNLFTNGTFC